MDPVPFEGQMVYILKVMSDKDLQSFSYFFPIRDALEDILKEIDEKISSPQPDMMLKIMKLLLYQGSGGGITKVRRRIYYASLPSPLLHHQVWRFEVV